MSIATLCVLQLLVGVLIDRRYDPGIVRFLPYAVWYPIIYWAFLALTTVVALPHLLRRPSRQSVRWSTARVGSAS